MTQLELGYVVRSLKGHDTEKLHLVLGTEEDFLYLADGKHRSVKAPKKKRRKHVIVMGPCPVTDRIQRGEPVLDSEIRRALAASRDKFSGTKEV